MPRRSPPAGAILKQCLIDKAGRGGIACSSYPRSPVLHAGTSQPRSCRRTPARFSIPVSSAVWRCVPNRAIVASFAPTARCSVAGPGGVPGRHPLSCVTAMPRRPHARSLDRAYPRGAGKYPLCNRNKPPGDGACVFATRRPDIHILRPRPHFRELHYNPSRRGEGWVLKRVAKSLMSLPGTKPTIALTGETHWERRLTPFVPSARKRLDRSSLS